MSNDNEQDEQPCILQETINRPTIPGRLRSMLQVMAREKSLSTARIMAVKAELAALKKPSGDAQEEEQNEEQND